MRQTSNRPSSHSQEDEFMHQLGDWMTGGKWRLFFYFFQMFIRLNSLMLALFLRFRIGKSLFSYGVWFWAAAYGWILIIFAQDRWERAEMLQLTDGLHPSAPLLMVHLPCFVFLLLIKWAIAVFSTGSRSWWFREKNSIGESKLYWLVRRIIPDILCDDEMTPRSWFKLNEERFMKYWEPLLLIVLGLQIQRWGYVGYGNFILFATACLAYSTFTAFQNTHAVRQAEMEAKALGYYMRANQHNRS